MTYQEKIEAIRDMEWQCQLTGASLEDLHEFGIDDYYDWLYSGIYDRPREA